MRRASLVSCLGAVLVPLSAAPAAAMGFGPTTMATTLGQRLDFVAHVSLEADETLASHCVDAKVMIGDNVIGGDNVRVAVENGRDGGERRVRVSTRIAVDEPVVTVDVSVGCASRMTRRFVAFVDPPALRLANAGDSEPAAARHDAAHAAGGADIARAADASRRMTAAGDRTSSPAAPTSRRAARGADDERRFDAAPALLPQEPRPAVVASTRKPARSGFGGRREASLGTRPRLLLEPASALAIAPSAASQARTGAPGSIASAPAVAVARISAPSSVAAPSANPRSANSLAASSLATTVATSSAVAPAGADAASAALATDPARVARIEELEAGLARVRSDSQAQQKTIGALQARLREADSARYANGLVYALAGGLIFFALLAAAFWALRPRQRRGARWFDANARARRPNDRAAPASPRGTSPTSPPAPTISQQPSQWRESAHAILPVTAPASIGGLEVTTVLGPQSHYARIAESASSGHAGASGVARGSSLSTGELIDLEQQAEFFVVLGQDEAAIELLAGHLRDTGGASPLPFLQLLEIHQRRGDRDAYEDVRRDYQTRFDAVAPEWSSGLRAGRALDAYPQTIARLQALWPTPMHAMQTLDALLFRRSEEEAFDFPAYRDLIFLYSVARELAGQVETGFGAIDLFLPLDGAPAERSSSGDSMFAVDVDISGWHDESEAERSVGRRAAGRRSVA